MHSWFRRCRTGYSRQRRRERLCQRRGCHTSPPRCQRLTVRCRNRTCSGARLASGPLLDVFYASTKSARDDESWILIEGAFAAAAAANPCPVLDLVSPAATHPYRPCLAEWTIQPPNSCRSLRTSASALGSPWQGCTAVGNPRGHLPLGAPYTSASCPR